jgi:hypothetical protein
VIADSPTIELTTDNGRRTTDQGTLAIRIRAGL